MLMIEVQKLKALEETKSAVILEKFTTMSKPTYLL